MRLLLFDIDGTLVHTQGCGKRSLSKALDELLGVQGALDQIALSGRTDYSLVREVFTSQNKPFSRALADQILERYATYLAQELFQIQERSHWILPGVRDILPKLEGKACLGLATGNVEQGARLKLQAVGIDGFFPVGGFGSDAEERAALVLAGAQKARRFYQKPFPEVLVIGDTPLDIYAAKENSFLAIGVASGVYNEQSLQDAGADVVLRSLQEEGVLEALLGDQTPS